MREIWRSIKANVQSNLSDMDKTVIRTNRELVFGAVAFTAVGMLVGLLLSPKKTVAIGSNNGNNNGNNKSGTPAIEAESEAEEDVAEE